MFGNVNSDMKMNLENDLEFEERSGCHLLQTHRRWIFEDKNEWSVVGDGSTGFSLVKKLKGILEFLYGIMGAEIKAFWEWWSNDSLQ